MKTKHTEGTIKATEPCAGDEYYFGHGNEIRLEDSEGNLLMVGHGNTEKDKANAARLALAWNCHDELVGVLKKFFEIQLLDGNDLEKLEDWEPLARAILAKATSAD